MMASDKIQADNSPNSDKGDSPGLKRAEEQEPLSQDDKIIELTEPVADARGFSGVDTPESGEPTIQPIEPRTLSPNDAPEAVSLDSLEDVAVSKKGTGYDDDIIDITPADLLDDEALSLAVEETIEALDLRSSELSDSTTTTGVKPLDLEIDVNDTLDEKFFQSLSADNFKGAKTSPQEIKEATQSQGDELDRLLEEMAGEIDEVGINPEETIILEDVVYEPGENASMGRERPQGPEQEIPTLEELELALAPSSDDEIMDLTEEILEMPGVSGEDGSEPAETDSTPPLTRKSLVEELSSDLPSMVREIHEDPKTSDIDQPSLSEAQIESVLERVITKMYAEKIDGMLNQVIERTVNREINRLKEILLADFDKE
jgi:hypothetical protein